MPDRHPRLRITRSVRQLVQSDGTVIDEIAYDSFGQILSETNASAGGHIPIHLQLGKKRLDLRRPHLMRMPFIVEQDEAFDP